MKNCKLGIIIPKRRGKKIKPSIVCIWWKVPRYCMQGVQRGFHFIPLLPNPGRIYVLHQCSPTEQFHAILHHKPIPVLTGSSMRDNGIFFTSSGNSPPTGHHLDTVWALLKIFEDICMFKFVELHCLMLFMFVHLAGAVESSSNNPIPNCEAEGLLHLLLVAAQTGVDDRPAR